MSGFQNIIGHEQLIEHLRNALQMNKISHAYLFQGDSGSGKRTVADAFAMALQCEEGGSEPCGGCHSCRQAASRNHPDIIYVTHEKPGSIGVDGDQADIAFAQLPAPGVHSLGAGPE